MPRTRRRFRSARPSCPDIYIGSLPRLRSSLPSANPIFAGALRELCKAHGDDLGLSCVVILEMRLIMCGSHEGSAAERDAVSRGVVSACRLRCLDRSAVDTRAEFESPSGAPPGYVCCSLVGLALFGPAEQQAPLERVAHGG